MFTRLFILLAAVQLSGCTTVFISKMMDGPTPCPSNVANTTYQNKEAMKHLRVGYSKFNVAQIFGKAPERVHTIYLADNSEIEAHFYRVRQPNACKYAERLAYNLKPIFFEGGVYIGQGYGFYNGNIKPHKVHVKASTNIAYLNK